MRILVEQKAQCFALLTVLVLLFQYLVTQSSILWSPKVYQIVAYNIVQKDLI